MFDWRTLSQKLSYTLQFLVDKEKVDPYDYRWAAEEVRRFSEADDTNVNFKELNHLCNFIRRFPMNYPAPEKTKSPKFYIASKLERLPVVAQVVSQLTANGWTPTYDWTVTGDVRDQGIAAWKRTADKEAGGVMEADIVCLTLPGGFGAHTEFGIALALQRISGRQLLVIHAEKETDIADPNGTGKINPFYFHKNVQIVVCPLDALTTNLRSLWDCFNAIPGAPTATRRA